MQKVAFITGIDGQDASYLAELLLSKDYKIYGLRRRHSSPNPWRIKHIADKIEIVEGDMLDGSGLISILKTIQPDEVYNMAAQSFVGESFKTPAYTAQVTGIGALNLIEAVRQSCKRAHVYQASSSEQFGLVQEVPQKETTPFYPRSPYGCAKVFAHQIFVNYRESYGMHASCGICFNHESDRRGEEFVTRKITKGLAKIVTGKQQTIKLGNLATARDWGHAKDFVRAMWMMLQQDTPDDYVIATGEIHTLKEFIEIAFRYSGLPGEWQSYIEFDPAYFRPADVTRLQGCANKAKSILGWQPEISFHGLVKEMMESDLQRQTQSVPQ